MDKLPEQQQSSTLVYRSSNDAVDTDDDDTLSLVPKAEAHTGTDRTETKNYASSLNADSGLLKNASRTWIDWVEAYSYCLDTRPLTTKAVSSAGIALFGDVFAQLVVERAGLGVFSFWRMGVMAIVGGVWIGPALHFWFGLLNRMITQQTVFGAVGRMAVDQFLFAWLFLPLLFGFTFLLEGRLEELPAHLRNNLWTIMQNQWTLWVPVQFCTFRYVPVKYQVVFTNCVALFWQAYLSMMQHSTGVGETVVND